MKILSWNIKRPKANDSRKSEIIDLVNAQNTDLIFLSETNSSIDFPDYYKIQTHPLPTNYNGILFSDGENKTTIFTKYPITKVIKTYDEFSSICLQSITEFGEIVLYGSIIGFKGGRDKYFTFDLEKQKLDLKKISLSNNLCFSGDLNISFSGHPYPSNKIQNEMMDFFDELNLEITTKNIENSAIHIVLSKELLKNKSVSISEIEISKKVSDHNMVITELH